MRSVVTALLVALATWIAASSASQFWAQRDHDRAVSRAWAAVVADIPDMGAQPEQRCEQRGGRTVARGRRAIVVASAADGPVSYRAVARPLTPWNPFRVYPAVELSSGAAPSLEAIPTSARCEALLAMPAVQQALRRTESYPLPEDVRAGIFGVLIALGLAFLATDLEPSPPAVPRPSDAQEGAGAPLRLAAQAIAGIVATDSYWRLRAGRIFAINGDSYTSLPQVDEPLLTYWASDALRWSATWNPVAWTLGQLGGLPAITVAHGVAYVLCAVLLARFGARIGPVSAFTLPGIMLVDLRMLGAFALPRAYAMPAALVLLAMNARSVRWQGLLLGLAVADDVMLLPAFATWAAFAGTGEGRRMPGSAYLLAAAAFLPEVVANLGDGVRQGDGVGPMGVVGHRHIAAVVAVALTTITVPRATAPWLVASVVAGLTVLGATSTGILTESGRYFLVSGLWLSVALAAVGAAAGSRLGRAGADALATALMLAAFPPSAGWPEPTAAALPFLAVLLSVLALTPSGIRLTTAPAAAVALALLLAGLGRVHAWLPILPGGGISACARAALAEVTQEAPDIERRVVPFEAMPEIMDDPARLYVDGLPAGRHPLRARARVPTEKLLPWAIHDPWVNPRCDGPAEGWWLVRVGPAASVPAFTPCGGCSPVPTAREDIYVGGEPIVAVWRCVPESTERPLPTATLPRP